MKLKILSLILLLSFITIFSDCHKRRKVENFEKIGSLMLNYTIRGNGPMMIVGHPSSGKIGYELTLKPMEKYFTMVYYDPRGTGKSQAPNTLEEYNLIYLVDEIEQLRKHLKAAKISLFGHSDQSAVALAYALKYPLSTSNLIVTGTSLIGTQQESIDRRKKVEMQRLKQSDWFAQIIADWDYMEEHKTNINELGKDLTTAPIKWWCYNEESFQKVLPIVREISNSGRRKAIDNHVYQETPQERQRYLNIQKKFSKISSEILIINGKFDTNNSPTYAKSLEQVLSNSELVIIDKAGHFPWIENPQDTFYHIERWLNEKNRN